MFCKENIYKKDFIHFVINGGLGDAVMALPVVLWGKKNILENNFIVTCPEPYDFLYKDFMEEKVYPFYELINWGEMASMKRIFPNPGFAPRTNLSKFFSYSLFGKLLKGEELNLPKLPRKNPTRKLLELFSLEDEKNFRDNFENKVVIPTSYRSDPKAWNKTLLKDFIHYLLDHDYDVILVGGKRHNDHPLVDDENGSKSITKEDLGIESNKVIDLTGLLSLEETFTVIQNSKFVVSITGGLVQLSALSDTPILCLCTYTNLYHSLYWRDGDFAGNTWALIPDDGKCRFCANVFFVHQVNYNKCPNNKNFECKDFDINKLIEKFEMMKEGIPCDTISKFKREELPYLDVETGY